MNDNSNNNISTVVLAGGAESLIQKIESLLQISVFPDLQT